MMDLRSKSRHLQLRGHQQAGREHKIRVEVEIKVETFGSTPVILDEAECREGSVNFPIESSLALILNLNPES